MSRGSTRIDTRRFLERNIRKFRSKQKHCESVAEQLAKQEIEDIKRGVDPRSLLALRIDKQDMQLIGIRFKELADELESSLLRLERLDKNDVPRG